MEFREAIQNINNKPKVNVVPLSYGNNCNNEDIIIEIKEEPELQICDEMEQQEIIDLTDVTTATSNTSDQYGCKNCPKIVTATGKIQQIHYCYLPENNKKLKVAKKIHDCDLCGEKFSFKSELYLHKRVLHRVKPSYKCMKCKRTLFSVNSYKQHVLHAHTDDTKIPTEKKTIKMKGVNSEGKPYNYDIMVYL